MACVIGYIRLYLLFTDATLRYTIRGLLTRHAIVGNCQSSAQSRQINKLRLFDHFSVIVLSQTHTKVAITFNTDEPSSSVANLSRDMVAVLPGVGRLVCSMAIILCLKLLLVDSLSTG